MIALEWIHLDKEEHVVGQLQSSVNACAQLHICM